MSDILLTVKEVALILKVTTRTVFRLFQAKVPLRSFKVGGGRRVRLSDLEEFLQKQRAACNAT